MERAIGTIRSVRFVRCGCVSRNKGSKPPPLRKGATIYFVVYDRGARKPSISSPIPLASPLSLSPPPPPPEAASSTPNLSLPLLCSGSVASTADSRNVRCRANCSSTPDPAPLSPRNWLTLLTLPQPPLRDVSTRGRRISLQPRSTFSPSSSIIPPALEFEVALHAVDVPSFVAQLRSTTR